MPSQLNEKSKQSLLAAESLQNLYYSSAVNRSYYAYVQCLLDILYTRLKVKKEEFDTQRRQNREGTHGWASKLIEIELAHIDRSDFKWYQRVFPEFQKLREKADYANEKIEQVESVGSVATAKALINCINQRIKQK